MIIPGTHIRSFDYAGAAVAVEHVNADSITRREFREGEVEGSIIGQFTIIEREAVHHVAGAGGPGIGEGCCIVGGVAAKLASLLQVTDSEDVTTYIISYINKFA